MRRSSLGRGVIAIIVAASIPGSSLAGQCGFRPEFTQPDEGGTRNVQVFSGNPVASLGNQRPLLFITTLKVNTDGTKISYHQDDPTGRRCATNPNATPCAINNVANAFRDHHRPVSEFEALRDAGYPLPATWQLLNPNIIEKDRNSGKPCISPDGYLVSMTADVAVPGGFNRQGDCDQSKWIDALTVPALVIPGESRFLALGVTKRSTAIAFSPSATKRVVPGIVGDVGPSNEIGEATVAMNRKLNGLAETDQPKHRQDAINRFQAGTTALLVFPGASSVVARPITAASVATAGNDALTKFGGTNKLYGCIKEEVDPNF